MAMEKVSNWFQKPKSLFFEKPVSKPVKNSTTKNFDIAVVCILLRACFKII